MSKIIDLFKLMKEILDSLPRVNSLEFTLTRENLPRTLLDLKSKEITEIPLPSMGVQQVLCGSTSNISELTIDRTLK